MGKSIITKIAEKACPAVITVVVSKDLPKIEGFSLLPFGGQQYMIPDVKGSKKENQKIGGGSGFIISEDGLILTSQHVVREKDADYTIIVEPEEKYSAKVLARDPINDMAILKIEADKKFPHIELGNSDKIELGEKVIAIGNALGEFTDTVSAGIVSGLSRYITAHDSIGKRAERLRGLIQTDAAINPGNSGGPLVNTNGKVIGINTAVVRGAQNIGFAIPINYAKEGLEEVKKHGRIRHPFLGVKYILIDKKIAEKNNLSVDYGALIVRETLGEKPIIEDSAAEKAGLKEFDIILECNENKITTENPLSHQLQEKEIGEEINLKILRNKKKKKIKAVLQEKE